MAVENNRINKIVSTINAVSGIINLLTFLAVVISILITSFFILHIKHDIEQLTNKIKFP